MIYKWRVKSLALAGKAFSFCKSGGVKGPGMLTKGETAMEWKGDAEILQAGERGPRYKADEDMGPETMVLQSWWHQFGESRGRAPVLSFLT